METLRCYDQDTYVERRASRRVRVTCEATLQTMTTQTSGSLVDISEAGARFEAQDPPGPGATALLRWGSHEAVCVIVWSQEDACGVAFKRQLPPEVVAETAALDRVIEKPIASVGNITQGRRRSMAFLKTANPASSLPSEDALVNEPQPTEVLPSATIGKVSLAEVLARYRRTGSWDR
jgi:hypothetical protein